MPEQRISSFVSYEAISGFLNSHAPGDVRSAYRAGFIASAATKSATSWKIRKDDLADAFWRAAYDLAIDEFHVLEMTPLNVTKGQTWITFRPKDMPSRPRHTYVALKGGFGLVDLTFLGSRIRLFLPLVKQLLESGMTGHQTGKSTAIRLQIEKIEVAFPDHEVRCRLRCPFTAVVRLIRFYRTNREFLDAAVAASIPA